MLFLCSGDYSMEPASFASEPERPSDQGAASFWEALDPIQRDAFRPVASPRTFATGVRLMSEGDQAAYVIVILSGRTKISRAERP